MTARNLKIYGLPRSCTNLVAWLVDENFPPTRAWHHGPRWSRNGDEGDKHFAPVALPSMQGYLLCVKGPFSWIASIRGYRPAPVATLAKRWSKRGREFIRFLDAREDAIVLRHRDLLTDPETELDRIATAFDLERTPETRLPRWKLARGGDQMRGVTTDEEFDPLYYLDRKFMRRFTEPEIAIVKSTLDAEVVEAFGYAEVLK